MLTKIKEWCNENHVSVIEAIGYMLHHHYYNEDKKIAGLGWNLFTLGKEALDAPDVPHDLALWLVERLPVGRRRYSELRRLLYRYSIIVKLILTKEIYHFTAT